MSITAVQLHAAYDQGASAGAKLGALLMPAGVNISGAEFGSVIPGTAGIDYVLFSLSELDYYISKGMTVIRVPFRWERIQPVLGGDLDPAHVTWLTGLVQHNPAVTILLDLHNYGYYNSVLIGAPGGPTQAQFADVWSRITALFPGAPNVAYGLMNEPSAVSQASWLASVNMAIASIRSAGGIGQILIPGANNFTGAWSWVSSGNAAILGNSIVDPLNNYVFDVHQYLDYNGSGSSATAVSATIGSERISSVTKWGRANPGKRFFLGEFGIANNSTMLAAMSDMLTYLRNNADVWNGGWAIWGAGPWWAPSYIYRVDQSIGPVDSAQMTALLPLLS